MRKDFYPAKEKTLLLLFFVIICAFLFTFLSIASYYTVDSPSAVILLFISLTLLALWFVSVLGEIILSKEPVVTIDHQGIYLNKTNGLGLISWEDIDCIQPYQVKSNHLVGITVMNINKYLTRLNDLDRKNVMVNLHSGFPPFYISLDKIKNSDQLLKYISELHVIQDNSINDEKFRDQFNKIDLFS